MIILQGQELGHAYGADDLFENLKVQLSHKDRVGMVGPNGSGKTTLLLILSGLLEPVEGVVTRREGLTLGYLRQEAVLTFAGQDNTIFEEMLTVFSNLKELEADMRELEEKMSSGDAPNWVFDEYGRIQDLYSHGGGYEYQHEIERVLTGLGFDREQWQLPLTKLSGGQKTRVLLGRLLLEKPDLLILDEPTNHLDTTAVEWLEKTLRQWPGALLVVSHDRYFLDRVINQVWELNPDVLKQFKGNYTSFVTQRDIEWERELDLFTTEKERLEKELAFVQKHIAGGKTDIAKGKLRRLTRDIVLLEEVGLLDRQGKSWLEIGGRVRTFSPNEAARRLKAIESPAGRPAKMKIKLKPTQKSSDLVLRTKKLQVGYPDAPLFTTDDLELERGDVVALIGPNGSGKSTMLRTILGELKQIKGKLRLGDELKFGYFAQGHEQLDMNKQVLDELLDHVPMSETDGRTFLGQYLFRGDDVFKQIKDLSGGERGRLALALLALEGANFLLLDEPTNHLDIPSQEVLQTVLERFDGTIVLVSHDRYLVNRLATQIWELRDDHLHLFEGTYQQFLAVRDGKPLDSVTAVSKGSASASKVTLPAQTKDDEPVDLSWVEEVAAPIPQMSRKERRQLSRQIAELRDEVEETEAWIEQLQFDISQAEYDQDEEKVSRFKTELSVAQLELDAQIARLDELMG
ncbi:MAG: ABC-F family ATP-binding cassette domain-containing protein [Chloroflexota bacterium]